MASSSSQGFPKRPSGPGESCSTPRPVCTIPQKPPTQRAACGNQEGGSVKEVHMRTRFLLFSGKGCASQFSHRHSPTRKVHPPWPHKRRSTNGNRSGGCGGMLERPQTAITASGQRKVASADRDVNCLVLGVPLASGSVQRRMVLVQLPAAECCSNHPRDEANVQTRSNGDVQHPHELRV